MNYQELTKDGLIEMIKDYQFLTNQLIIEVDRDAGFDAASNCHLGHWYLNLKTDMLAGNPIRFRAMGYTEEELMHRVPYQDFINRIHPDDVQALIDKLEEVRSGNRNEYEVEYKIYIGEQGYQRFYDRGRVTEYADDGSPLFLSGTTRVIPSGRDDKSVNKDVGMDLAGEIFLDNLTKSKNRRALLQDLRSAAVSADQSGNPFTLTLIGIDNFKSLNESKGHLCGNKVLIDIAGLIRDNIGEKGIFGRYNTDEFMIIFTNTDQEAAKRILEKINASVERYPFPEKVKVAVNGGMKEFQGEDLSELVAAVEMKLLQAKACGKNKIAS